MSSIVAKLINFAGLTGSIPANTLSGLPKTQAQLSSNFEKADQLANQDIWNIYNEAMKQPQTLDAAYQLWNEMANWDLVAAALTEIVDEVCTTDSHSPGVLWFKCNDAKVEDSLNDMLSEIGVEDILPSQVYHLAGYGNSFDKVEYTKGEGVQALTYAHPMEMRRYWLERTRKCVGYRWARRQPEKSVIDIGLGSVSRNQLQLSNTQTEDLWYPWDFMHMRRMLRSRMNEHGEPLFADAQQLYKKLRIALDQMVVHRAQIQPDRYAIDIDTQDQPPAEQMKTVQRWKQSMRSKLTYGGASNPFGALEDFKSFYNPLALDTILWIAKPKGFNHAINKLAGTTSVPDVYDIELLTNLFFTVLGMPKSWLGIGDSKEGGPVSGKALLAQDMRFLRKIKALRRPIIQSYTWLGYFHAILCNKDIEQLDIRVEMSPIGSLEDQIKLEMLSTQADIMSKLGDIMQAYNLPREVWIDIVFRQYMHLPDDVVNVFLTALPKEVGVEESKTSAPSSRKIYEEIVSKIGHERLSLIKDFHNIMDGKAPQRRKYRKPKDVAGVPVMETGDCIISGYGQINPLMEEGTAKKPESTRTISTGPAPTVSQTLFESEGYRRTMNAHLKV